MHVCDVYVHVSDMYVHVCDVYVQLVQMEVHISLLHKGCVRGGTMPQKYIRNLELLQ